MRRTAPLVAALAALSLSSFAGAADAQTSSSFAQLAGRDGCVVQTLPASYYGDDEGLQGKCDRGHGLLQAEGVAVSPDQGDVYVASAGTPHDGSNAVVAFRRDAKTGALAQVGCVSDDGGDGRSGSDGLCTDGDALGGAGDVVVSPDGRNVYVSTTSASGVAWFDRDPATGKLTQAGCFKAFPRGDRCSAAPGLVGADGVTVSPDGLSVYVSAGQDDAVTAFQRDPATGALTFAGCVSDTGTDGLCTDGTALSGASSVAVSPDSRFVYVTASTISAVTTYSRDPATSRLTPAGCILDVAPEGGPCTAATALAGASSLVLSPDGGHAYVAASATSAVLAFTRDATSGKLTQTACLRDAPPAGDDAVYPDEADDLADEGTDGADDTGDDVIEDPLKDCGDAKAIEGAEEITMSADGRSLFVASSGTLAAFDAAAGGKLTQTGCLEEDQTYKSCGTALGLYGASGLASSADGRSLYVASRNDHAVGVFGAAVAITTRSARVRGRGTRVRLACPVVRTSGCRGRLLLARHSRAYAVKAGHRRTYAVRVPLAIRRAAGRHAARVVVRATDARRLTRASTRRVTLRR